MTDIWGHSEIVHARDTGGNGDQGSEDFLLVFVWQHFAAQVFLVVIDPCSRDTAPDDNFTFWLLISHEADLELLQRSVEVGADYIVDRLYVFE